VGRPGVWDQGETMILRATILAIALCLLPAAVCAQMTIIGAGATLTCGAWSGEAAEDDALRRYGAQQWLWGYLSAKNTDRERTSFEIPTATLSRRGWMTTVFSIRLTGSMTPQTC
jgi:hypothetical protein